MMSSKPTPHFMDQVAQGTLPRVERTVGTTLSSELPKSGYPPEDPVNYSGTYFYCLSGAAGTDLSPHWSPPGASLQKSPIVHPPSTGQPLTNQITHRPEKTVHCMENSPSSVMQDLAANQKQAYYDKFPGKQSSNVPRIHAPTAVRKLGIGGASISPPRENIAGLAVPKPIYGHNPCCTEHGCTSGACYSMERGMPRLHPNSYDDEWMLHYGPLSLLQRKEREALLQQGLLQLEQSAVQFPLRDTRPEGYRTLRPSGPVRFPPFAEQNYGSFPYTSPTRSPLSPSSELFHRLQFPSKVYHGLHPPSTCTYEEMQQMALTYPGIQPKIYPDHPPPVPRYTHLPQRPMFYYPQGSIEIENSVPYKGAGKKLPVEPPSSTNKQVPSDSPGSCLRPPLTQTDFSASCPTAPANPSFPRDCDLSPFQVYRTHTGTVGQKRTFAEGPGAPLLVRHTEQPVDYSAQRARIASPQRRLCKQPLSPGAFHPIQQPLPDYRSSDHMSVAKCKILANHRSEDKQASPKQAVPHCGVGQRQHGAWPGPGPGPAMHASSPCTEVAASEKHRPNANSADHTADLSNMAQVDKSHNIYEVEAPNRLQEKAADQNLIERLQNPPSPPMPVINKVFSLAPYKAYLQASGMLPSQKGLPVGAHCNDNNVKSDTQRHTADPQQDVVEPMYKVTSVVCAQPSPEAGPICMLEPHEIKTENVSLEDTHISVKSDETGCEGGHQSLKEITRTVKEEDTNEVTSSSDSVLDLRVKKGDCDVSASEIQTSTGLSSSEYRVGTPDAIGTVGVLTLNCNNEHSVHMALPPKPVMPALVPPDKKVFFQHVPPQGVKLSAFKIIVPDVLRPPPQTHQTQALEVPQPTPEPKPAIDSSRQARHRFMEMQQSLFRLISASVAQAPEPELRAWLAKTEPLEPTSPQSKALCVSGLLGTATREAWLRCKDTAAALARVAGQLEDYAVTRQCPFPHVIRAGTLFIPMLVVKECLFPQVSGALIDKVLQEHHVELRPTTLSEERHLMQLQRRACSSKLRRLLSLKHLPEIYPDMLNLFYHACVSKRLGSVLSTPVKTEKPEYSEEAEGSRSGMSTESTPGPLGPCEHLKDVSMGSRLKKQKRKGRRRGASKRKLLEKDKLIEGDTFGYSAQSESWSIVNSFSLDGDGQGSQSPHSENLETMNIKLEENSSSEEVSQGCKEEPESTWGPLTSDELSSGNSDTEIEKASLPQYRNQPSNTTKSQAIPKSHSGMILKLRKVLFKYPYGRDLGYQPARDNTQPDHMGDQGGRGGIEERQKEQSVARRMRPRVARRRQRAGSFPEVLRPTRSSSKVPRLHGSLQLKYCPHLSACYCSQHRRRWVLRSAVQTARRAMKNRYPDLVGKRIRHLYEENDKSEVWYRGVVVRVHEPHLNPLKTVFEVKYDSEPEWQYYLELLMDYKKGWLKVED